MANVTPLTQSPHESLLNALQIAQLWEHRQGRNLDSGIPFTDIARLLRDALAKMGEPHPHTVELTRRYLEASAHDFGDVTDQEARDLAMVVITSALKWEAP